jgi:large subunit ribosomal protein L9
MATALSTIGKFTLKKKAGEGDALFGTVTAADVVDVVFQQTGKQLDKRNVNLPADGIKTLGTHDVTVKLHPEVVGSFKIVVQKGG